MSGRLPGNFHHAFDVGSVADNFDEKMVCHSRRPGIHHLNRHSWLDCNNSIYRGEETMSTVFWAALVACGILVAVLLIARHRQG